MNLRLFRQVNISSRGRNLVLCQSRNRAWILGYWSRQIVAELGNSAYLRYVPISTTRFTLFGSILSLMFIRGATNYYFTHPLLFKICSRLKPSICDKSTVLYTHHQTELGSLSEQAKLLSRAKKIQFMSRNDRDSIVNAGLLIEKTSLIYGAIDDEIKSCQNFAAPNKTVLIVANCIPRKNPEGIFTVIESLPDFAFTIVGSGWHDFQRKNNRQGRVDNARFLEWNSADRNLHYSNHRYFLSLSLLEGGPIPLLEALKSGLYIITTNTGFAEEFVKLSSIGRILPIADSPAHAIQALLNCDALEIDSDTYERGCEQRKLICEQLNWRRIASDWSSTFELKQ